MLDITFSDAVSEDHDRVRIASIFHLPDLQCPSHVFWKVIRQLLSTLMYVDCRKILSALRVHRSDEAADRLVAFESVVIDVEANDHHGRISLELE